MRPSFLRRTTVLIAAGLCCALPASIARADTKTLDFESGPATGTSITTQYSALQGVRFANGPEAETGVVPKLLAPGAGIPSSGSRVLGSFTNCGGAIEFAFCDHDLWIQFTRAGQETVSFRAGPTSAQTSHATIDVTAYSLSGQQLASTTQALPQATGVHTPTSIHTTTCSPSCSIAEGPIGYVHIFQHHTFVFGENVGIDDLTYYDPGPGPVKPSFGITRDAADTNETSTVGVKLGGSATVPLHINRLGSVGLLQFSTIVAPPGVTATFTPNPAGGASATMTVHAAASAKLAEKQTLTVEATRPSAAPGEQKIALLNVAITTVKKYDLSLEGMTITQGIQNGSGIQNAIGSTTHQQIYSGLRLAARGRTFVEVFADAAAGPDTGVPGVHVTLSGFRFGKPLGATPTLISDTQTAPLRTPTSLDGQRKDSTKAYVFELPQDWTKPTSAFNPSPDGLALVATVHGPEETTFLGPEPTTSVACGTATCAQDDTFTVSGIPFYKTGKQWFRELDFSDKSTPPDHAALAETDGLVPAGESDFKIVPMGIFTNVGADIAQCKKDNPLSDSDADEDRRDCGEDVVMDVTDDYQDDVDNDNTPYTSTVGLYRGDLVVGVTETYLSENQAVVQASRPVGSVAHESFHLLDASHSDTQCGGDDGTQSGDDLVGDGGYGHITGWGFDRSDAKHPVYVRPTGIASSKFTKKRANVPNSLRDALFDFMSYCGIFDAPNKGGNDWISTQQWNRTLNHMIDRLDERARPRATTRATGPAGLRVEGRQDPDGTFAITEIAPVAHTLPLTARAAAASPLRLQLSTGAATLATVPAAVGAGHRDVVDGTASISSRSRRRCRRRRAPPRPCRAAAPHAQRPRAV